MYLLINITVLVNTAFSLIPDNLRQLECTPRKIIASRGLFSNEAFETWASVTDREKIMTNRATSISGLPFSKELVFTGFNRRPNDRCYSRNLSLDKFPPGLLRGVLPWQRANQLDWFTKRPTQSTTSGEWTALAETGEKDRYA